MQCGLSVCATSTACSGLWRPFRRQTSIALFVANLWSQMTALWSFVASIVYTSVVSRDLSVFADCAARIAIRTARFCIHECMVDVSVPPSNRVLNSMILPVGFPAPLPTVSFLCCHRRGAPPEFALLSNPRSKSVELCAVFQNDGFINSAGCSVNPCSQCAEAPHLVVDCAVDAGGCGVSSARGVRNFPSR